MTKPYEITNIMDFTQIPPERLTACLNDFAKVVPEIRQKIDNDRSIGKPAQILFKWLDDGASDSVYIKDMPDEVNILQTKEPAMMITNLYMQGLKVISFPVFEDETGYTIEPFNKEKFKRAELPFELDHEKVLIIAGRSVRGLYYQSDPPQANLFMCLTGSVLLVAVELRECFSAFGMHYAIELRAGSGKAFFIPPGFAYGIAVTGEETALVSRLSSTEDKEEGQGKILWCDEDLGIPWSFTQSPNIAGSDMTAQSFSKFQLNNPFNEGNWKS